MQSDAHAEHEQQVAAQRELARRAASRRRTSPDSSCGMPSVTCTMISSISSSMPTVDISVASGLASGMKWKQVR